MGDETPRLLVVGAHPDDCEISAGGIASKYVAAGREVHFLSVTDGSAGHHEMDREELARRRREETKSVADAFDVEYHVWDIADGKLRPSLENRQRMIRLIRRIEPGLVLTHRPNDYHPDHRYTSRLVCDASYMVTVPNVCSDTPPLRTDPVIGYVPDDFQKPYAFDPDVVVEIDDVVDTKIEMCHRHESQMYEWLPHHAGTLDEVPDAEDEHLRWLRENRDDDFAEIADKFRTELRDRYGEKRGSAVRYAEAVEVCEYGRPLTDELAKELFPF